jgi:hypothetical protein
MEEEEEEEQLNMLVNNHFMHLDTNAVRAANTTLTPNHTIVSVVAQKCESNRDSKRDTTNPTSMGVLQSGQSSENVQESKEAYLIRVSYEQYQPPPKPSKNAPYYSYHFQCWNCLHYHEGIIRSDNQLLEIECDHLLDFEFDPLFNIMGKPRKCGKINHAYGRKTKQESRRKN